MFLWVFDLDVAGDLGKIVTQRNVSTHLFIENSTKDPLDARLGEQFAVVSIDLVE